MIISKNETPDNIVRLLSKSYFPDGYEIKIKNLAEWHTITNSVNQGIDSHLEGFTRSVFDSQNMECLIHPEELHILLRRLIEEGELGESLRSDILFTLGIEEV